MWLLGRELTKRLEGWPDHALSWLLVGLGALLILAGLCLTSPLAKAGLAAWVLLP